MDFGRTMMGLREVRAPSPADDRHGSRPLRGSRLSWFRRSLLLGGALLLLAMAGCIVEAPPAITTVELVNETTGDVTPNLYVSATAENSDLLFSTSANLRTDFTDRPFRELRANETRSIQVSCDQLRALGVLRPVLFDAAQLQVSASDDVIFLAAGGDFECGKTVRFTYFREGDAFRVRYDIDP